MKRLLICAVLVCALPGCGSEADIPAIEREVEAGILEQLDTAVVVDCPDQIDWEPGRDFYCFAAVQDGPSTRISITMANDAGEWSWAVG